MIPPIIKIHFNRPDAFEILSNIRRFCLLQLFSDLRLVKKIISLPIEEKIKIKDILNQLGFESVIEALENAEDNIISKTPKDAADRCREALEKLIEITLIKIKETPKKFSENLRLLKNKSIIDLPTQTDFQGFYSHLAQMGLHDKASKEILEISSNYFLDEAYRKVMKFLSIVEKKLK